MRKLQLPLFVIFLFCCLEISGQKKTTQPGTTYAIPFQLTEYNNLSVQAILNQRDTVRLMFHTAANAVTLTEEALGKVTSLKFEGADTVKSWGGEENVSRFSKSNSIIIGDLQWNNVPIWENKYSGQQTDGKFGIDLFENKVVEIDFDKSILTVSSELPFKTKRYEKLKAVFENDMLFIEATSQVGNTNLKNKYLIHSGYPGAVLYDDQFTTENKISTKLKVVDEKEMKDSFGNVLKTKKAIVPAFRLGKEKLTNVPVGFFEGALGRQKMSILGGDVLKRFNIIIDARRQYIYLKPNSLKHVNYWKG
jgi:hypothetical protein